MLPRDERSKKLIQGQLNIGNLIVARCLSRDTSRVIYKFPLSFEIHATKDGVSFVGGSTNFDPSSVNQVIKILRWAKRIARDMHLKRGTIPQEELEYKIKLKTRKVQDGFRAWYEGKASQAIERKTENEAVASLRAIYLQLNERH